MKKSGILLSGGMDSVALAYWKRPTIAITIDYGQRPAKAELQASSAVCHVLGIEHKIISIDCSCIGSGDLAGTAALSCASASEWWPYRNQLLVTFAAAALLSRGVDTLLVATVAPDRQHADGSPQFIAQLSELMALQEGGVRVEAPAIDMSSAELVRTSNVPIEVLAWAHSCHVANFACGRCRGCAKHFATMGALGFGPY